MYSFIKCPFGISTSQVALIRALNEVFKDAVNNFTIIYTDDVCAFSGGSFEIPLKHLKTILDKLQDARMIITRQNPFWPRSGIF